MRLILFNLNVDALILFYLNVYFDSFLIWSLMHFSQMHRFMEGDALLDGPNLEVDALTLSVVLIWRLMH